MNIERLAAAPGVGPGVPGVRIMLRRIFWILGIILGLALGAALLGPFLISTQSLAGREPASAAATPQSRFVEIPFPGIQGIELHYLMAGPENPPADAPVFILLHGFTFNAFTWRPALDFFARQGRVFAFDQIPYGLSAKLTPTDWDGPNPYAKEAAIAQLFAFMDALGIQRATLVGNSSGGTLAMEAALARPERVERLILVAPWVYAQRPTLPAAVAELPQLRRISLLIGRKLGEGGLLDYSYADPGRLDEERRSLMKIHTRVANWDLAWGELLNRSLSSPVTVSTRLDQITQPILLVTGDQDKLVPVADTRKVAERLPHATLAVLPGCGHVPQEECPGPFEQAVAGWLRGSDPDTASPKPPG